MMVGIYKIQSIINPNRAYVGSAINIPKRWKLHLFMLRKGNHHSKKLQRHYDKYTESDLQFSILIRCDKHDLIKEEQYFIDTCNPYFNGCKKAGNCLGYKHSEETKEKHRRPRGKKSRESVEKTRIGCIGKKRSDETKQKMRIAKLGKTRILTEDHKRKIGNAHRGKIVSIEARMKSSESHKGHKVSELTRERMRQSHKLRKAV